MKFQEKASTVLDELGKVFKSFTDKDFGYFPLSGTFLEAGIEFF